MSRSHVRCGVWFSAILLALAGPGFAIESSSSSAVKPASTSGEGSSASASATTAASTAPASTATSSRTLSLPASSTRQPVTRSSGKGPLPDPTLLDGSSQQADKKPENGMLGEFELPGDDNAPKGSKVGGQQNPNQGGGGGQQQQQGMSVSMPNPLNMPQGGGAQGQQQQQGGGQQGQMAGAQGGASGGGAEQQGAQAGGGAAGGEQAAGAQGAGGAGDPNATAQGIQVGGLSGEGSAQNAAGANTQKPGAVAIGDNAMRIQTTAGNANDVVGQPAQGPVQAMEKQIGHAAKSTTGDNTNRGAERGRAMPTGL